MLEQHNKFSNLSLTSLQEKRDIWREKRETRIERIQRGERFVGYRRKRESIEKGGVRVMRAGREDGGRLFPLPSSLSGCKSFEEEGGGRSVLTCSLHREEHLVAETQRERI